MAFKLIQNEDETLTLGYLHESRAMDEVVGSLTGTTPTFDPDDPDVGTITTWTLTANSTPVDGLTSGQSMTLMIDDGTDYGITWPTITWDVTGGAAPTLKTTGYTTVVIWKVGTTLYGRY